MKINLSNRAKLLGQTDIRAMSLECEKVKGINLSQGVSDLPINPVVEQAAKRAIEKGINHYTRYDGLDELRQAIAGKLKRDNILKVDADKNIIVSSGATGALYSAFLALLNPGDEIIILEPFYGYHLSTVLAVDLKPVFVSTAPPDWKIDFDRLEKSISSKTKGSIICTPANPSGKVFTSGELKQIGELVIKHDLLIFTDEIYEYFLYDGNKHVSPFSFPEFQEKTIMVSGYSKTFSITGWRIGYLVCDERYKEAIGDISDLVYVCAPAPLQTGVAQELKS